jgi:hypothetical protein
VSTSAKLLGIIIPVLLATTFCLTIPFIILIADTAVLGAAIYLYASTKVEDSRRKNVQVSDTVAS